MFFHHKGLTVWLLLPCLCSPLAGAQFGGSRAGIEVGPSGVAQLPLLDREIVERFITIDGRAEIRVQPTEIRIVMAVTSEGVTAQECQQSIETKIERLRTSWEEDEIPTNDVVEDFISVLPLYEWNIEKQGDVEVGVEKNSGFRMQTNLHAAVPDEAQAAAALTVAFEQGVTDIIAFDYGSRELDEVKRKAREQALEAVQRKSEFLLGSLFVDRPAVL
ncbi:MAG: SIMPL domain-containing protein, partial [Planctomycetota bacterium]